MDLGTHQYGVAFLASDPAEVMLRRMYALVLGCRAGTMAMAEMLEELPGDHTVADMPDEMIDELEKNLCVRRKIESTARSSRRARALAAAERASAGSFPADSPFSSSSLLSKESSCTRSGVPPSPRLGDGQRGDSRAEPSLLGPDVTAAKGEARCTAQYLPEGSL